MTKSSQPRNQRIVRKGVRRYATISRVVLGVKENALMAQVAEKLRARGLEVSFTPSAEEARKSTVGHTDTAVVVPMATEAGGGLLTTAKIVTALPTAKVILLTPVEDDRVSQFAEFIDANVAVEADGVEAIVAKIVE